MLDAWYIPSSTGDFRLEANPDDPTTSILTVEDLTASERERIEAFRKRCRAWKWFPEDAVLPETGRAEILINTTVAKAGKHLAKDVMPNRGTLTAIRSADGEIICTADFTEGEGKLEKGAADPKAKKATTVKKPTICCPDPVEGPLKRSSRVLREFCTPSQWKEWVEKGVLHCVGGETGVLYRLVHRHHPLAAKQGKIGWSVDDDCVMHFWDWSVPPAEEVLSAKLILEHREFWLRNRATMFGIRSRDAVDVIPNNPLGNSAEGTWDAGFFTRLGGPQGAEEPAMVVAAGMLAAAVI